MLISLECSYVFLNSNKSNLMKNSDQSTKKVVSKQTQNQTNKKENFGKNNNQTKNQYLSSVESETSKSNQNSQVKEENSDKLKGKINKSKQEIELNQEEETDDQEINKQNENELQKIYWQKTLKKLSRIDETKKFFDEKLKKDPSCELEINSSLEDAFSFKCKLEILSDISFEQLIKKINGPFDNEILRYICEYIEKTLDIKSSAMMLFSDRSYFFNSYIGSFFKSPKIISIFEDEYKVNFLKVIKDSKIELLEVLVLKEDAIPNVELSTQEQHEIDLKLSKIQEQDIYKNASEEDIKKIQMDMIQQKKDQKIVDQLLDSIENDKQDIVKKSELHLMKIHSTNPVIQNLTWIQEINSKNENINKNMIIRSDGEIILRKKNTVQKDGNKDNLLFIAVIEAIKILHRKAIKNLQIQVKSKVLEENDKNEIIDKIFENLKDLNEINDLFFLCLLQYVKY